MKLIEAHSKVRTHAMYTVRQDKVTIKQISIIFRLATTRTMRIDDGGGLVLVQIAEG